MEIIVKCKSPSYAKGKYNFHSLEELLKWFNGIRSIGKSGRSNLIFALAKGEGLSLAKHGLKVDVEFNSPDYFLANKLAEETGLLQRGMIKPNDEYLAKFVKFFDANKL